MSSITLRFLAEPGALKPGTKVHGGSVMKWIDEAGYACAAGWAKRDCATVYVDGIRFHKPVLAGDLVEVQARLAYTGNSSMNIAVEVRSGDVTSGMMEKTTECVIVLVALDDGGRPLPIDSWNPETPGEVALATRVRTQLEAARAAHP